MRPFLLSPYWTDPDVANDPRKEQLTARMVLTHTTGFPNWRFFRTDGKLVSAELPGRSTACPADCGY
jgi:CubicO group peptidase (beta-lactamase class C family)